MSALVLAAELRRAVDALARVTRERDAAVTALGDVSDAHGFEGVAVWRALGLAGEPQDVDDVVAAVTDVAAERDAAVAARDALATAVREYMDSSRAAAGDYLRATLADDHKAALADVDRRHSGRRLNATARLTALLDGAPADVVRGDVVRAYLAAADAYDTAGLRVLEDDEADDITESEARDVARAALDAALAPGGGR